MFPGFNAPVVKMNVSTGEMKLVPLPDGFTYYSIISNSIFDGEYMWLIPGSGADRILRIHPQTDEVKGYNSWPTGYTHQPGFSFAGATFDGKSIWLIPQSTNTKILRLDVKTGEMKVHDNWPTGFNKAAMSSGFAGAVFDGTSLFLVPTTADRVIKVYSDPAPTDILITKSSVAEKLATGTTVGTLSATDKSTNPGHVFSLVSGDGATDNGSFSISGNVLKTAAVLNSKVKSSLSIRVKVVNKTEGTFEKILTIKVDAGDTKPPSLPTGLKISNITKSGFTISWSASTDESGISGYNLYLNGNVLKTVNTNQTILTDLKSFTQYNVAVQSIDKADNRSTITTAVKTRTLDETPPTTPTKFTISKITISGFTVAWTASTDNAGVASYEVYRNGKLAGTTKTLSYTFTNLNETSVQSIQVLAVDAQGNKSKLSAAVKTAPTIQIKNYNVYLNFKMLSGVGKVESVKGNAMVQYKPYLESLGLTVAYDTKTKTITAKKVSFSMSMTQGKATAIINNTKKSMPIEPTLVNGKLMVPLSFIAKELGYTVVNQK
jgi:chitodextrinase